MRPFGIHAGPAALSGAVLLLAGWFVYGLVTESGSDGAQLVIDPGPEPELIGVVVETPHTRSATAQNQSGSIQVRQDQSAAVGVAADMRPAAAGAAPGQVPVAYAQLLDRVFAPDRVVRPSAVHTVGSDGHAAADTTAAVGPDGGSVMWGNVASARQAEASASGREAEVQDAVNRSRVQTEKAYHEEFVALAAKDAKEFEQQAFAVLREDGEDCKKVAMLRVLYDTDQTSALQHFNQVIATLPDRPRPEGDSVPAFAVGYLGKRLADPAVKGMLEQIACSRYGNLSANLQQIAAKALLTTATPSDLQRYAEYPVFQTAAAAAATAEAR
jgi:hypothetical protein